MNTAEQFWARVKKGNPNACWEWQGARNSSGYGTLRWCGDHVTAFRVAAHLAGLVDDPHTRCSAGVNPHVVMHSCDNRLCCNPKHLSVGTKGENQRQAYARGGKAQPKGEHHANAKLTNTQAKTIRNIYRRGGVRQVDLAALYGVSQRCICLIVRGETYA